MFNCEGLRERLADLGYETDENEYDVLERAINRAEQTVLNAINSDFLPPELEYAAVDIAAGEYLLGKTKDEALRGVSSVSEGDVSVSFDNDSEGNLIDRLLNSGKDEMASFRRVKW